MAELVAALLLSVPWMHPLAFRPLAGWQTGASGTVRSAYVGKAGDAARLRESSAWTATGVRYRDPPTADPPNATLGHLPPAAIVVWAVAIQAAKPDRNPIRLELARARRFACCEGAGLPAGVYELTGSGPGTAYSVIVRVYFGSPPTRALRARAQEALDHLRLPARRRG